VRGTPHIGGDGWTPDPTDADIYNHLAYCLAEVGNLPWSTCVELSSPRVTINGRTWQSRRVRMLNSGAGYAYGYSRRQTKQMIAALHIALLAQANHNSVYLRQTAAELGLPIADTSD